MSKKNIFNMADLTKSQQDCLQLIEALGIYELRGLARVFGDNTPTMMKRDELVKIVMDKIISGEELKALPMRAGRPYKELSNISGILTELSQITGKNYDLSTVKGRASSTFKTINFSQKQDDIFNKKLFPIEVKGILMPHGSKDFIIPFQENGCTVLVDKESNKKLSLYDYVTGTAYIMNQNKEYMLDKIHTVNFENCESYEPFEEEYIQTLPNKTITFQNSAITLGSRNILKNKRFAQNAVEFSHFIQKLNDEGILTLALVPNVMFEDGDILKKIGFSALTILKYEERQFQLSDAFNNFIENASRLQKQGKNLALFVQDIVTFENAIDYVCTNGAKDGTTHTPTTAEMLKKLVLLAKAGQNNHHTTLFATMDDSDILDSLFVSSIYKVSKVID